MAGRRRRWPGGRLGYALSTLREIGRVRNRRVELTLEGPAGTRSVDRRVLFVAFANGPSYGGGMQICPDASLADALMDLCIVGDVSRLETVRQLPGLYRGRRVNHPAVELTPAAEVTIEGQRGTLAHLDGEPFGGLPLRVEVVPGAISVAAVAPDEPTDRLG